ncbi:hypothetical protein [Actinomadura sp. 3N508]|uniref:hypothetical protein n=1 Tax=Actinomadura sp. 3N508 TaxID=3375153 RepID=UPI00378EF57A
MDEVSERVRRRARNDFPQQADQVIESLGELTTSLFPRDAPGNGHERIHVAALILAQGDVGKFERALALARSDWRDLLVFAGLGNEDWEALVDSELAPPA